MTTAAVRKHPPKTDQQDSRDRRRTLVAIVEPVWWEGEIEATVVRHSQPASLSYSLLLLFSPRTCSSLSLSPSLPPYLHPHTRLVTGRFAFSTTLWWKLTTDTSESLLFSKAWVSPLVVLKEP